MGCEVSDFIQCRHPERVCSPIKFAFSCGINQTAEPCRRCWSTAFIMGPEGSLSPDFRPLAPGIEISVQPGRPQASCSPLKRLSFPASSLQSPWCCESPQIPKVPTAMKPTLGSHRTGRRASNRDVHEFSEDTAIWRVSSLSRKILSMLPVANAHPQRLELRRFSGLLPLSSCS